MNPIVKVNIASSQFKANPFPFYAQLRTEAPVYRTKLPDQRNAWLVTRYRNLPIGQTPSIQRGKFLFFALVREKLHLVCDLKILFLRRENPGHLISGGGDLDNRIRVLFDALRVPQDDNEVRGLIPAGASRVLLCLTEDDKLMTGFCVTTDRLLEPAASEAEKNNIQLVIDVEVKATKLTEENMAYFSHF